uniref:Mismatch repair endonuclease PMS2 (inferred by orthology to a human protein) n=1 Tax=Strongyloides venezuelensis TaxID=75913 RepID=A0A0K0F6P5_STRVS
MRILLPEVVITTKVESGPGYCLEFYSGRKHLPEKKEEFPMNVEIKVEVTNSLCRYSVSRQEYESNVQKRVKEVMRMLQGYALSRVDVTFKLLNVVGRELNKLMGSSGPYADIKFAISSIFFKKMLSLRNTVRLEDVEISNESCELFESDKIISDFEEVNHVRFEDCISGLDNVGKDNLDHIYFVYQQDADK